MINFYNCKQIPAPGFIKPAELGHFHMMQLAKLKYVTGSQGKNGSLLKFPRFPRLLLSILKRHSFNLLTVLVTLVQGPDSYLSNLRVYFHFKNTRTQNV